MTAMVEVAAVVAVAVVVALPVTDAVSNHSYHPSFVSTGNAVDAWTQCTGVNPWELSKLEDTDILVLRSRWRALMKARQWENHTVPYIIEVTNFAKEEIKEIREAIERFNELSCLKFSEADSYVPDYVRITGQRHGCYSEYSGRMGGKQVVNLQPKACLLRATILHELFHVAGFAHQHNALNRDSYITLKSVNIDKADLKHFTIYTDNDNTTNVAMKYDYDSIMHISRRAHSKNGRDTFETHDSSAIVGQVTGPSFHDIVKLKLYYQCFENTVTDL